MHFNGHAEGPFADPVAGTNKWMADAGNKSDRRNVKLLANLPAEEIG